MGMERCFAQVDHCQPADSKATPEARALLERLYRIQKRGTMYGHQDDLMCGYCELARCKPYLSVVARYQRALSFTTALARQKHKLHALSECGPISEDLQRILANYESAYLLTWRHAPQRGDRPAMRKLTDAELKKLPADVRENYLRWLKQPRHEDLLKTMKQNKRYLFLKDIQNNKKS